MNKSTTFLLLLAIILYCVPLQAQTETPYYIGVKAGIPLGVSTFTSFGADNARTGYSLGLLAGYRHNPIFSAELSAMMGSMQLGLPEDFADFWLASDGVRHVSTDLGKQGHYYRDIYSSIAMQQYGAQLNVDLLSLVAKLVDGTSYSRFALTLSPAVYAVATQASLKTSADDKDFIIHDKQVNLALGAELSLAYRLADNIDLRISSGANTLLGDKYDGIPSGHNNSNLTINSNIAVVWRLGRKPQQATPTPAYVESQQEIEKQIAEEKEKERERIALVKKQEEIKAQELQQKKLVVQQRIEHRKEVARQTAVAHSIVFPSIYFDYGVSNISLTKFDAAVMESVRLLNDNPMIEITIKGYADRYGMTEANVKVSLGRANTLKRLLIDNGIAHTRIATMGMGVDTAAKNRDEARRADIHLKVNNSFKQ